MNDAVADAQRAMRLVRSRAPEFGINPSCIGMVGYSAGANLTLHAAGDFDAGNPQAADPIERASSRPDFIALTRRHRISISELVISSDAK